MAKKKKLTKEEITGPDAFQSFADQVSKFLSDNWQIFAGIIAILIVGGIGVVTYSGMKNAAEEAAQADLYPGLKEISDIQREIAELETSPSIPMTEKADKETAAKREETSKGDEVKLQELRDKMDSKTESLMSRIEAHRGTQSAQVATLNLSGFLIGQEKYQRAKSILLSLIPELAKGTANYGVARSQLASTLSYIGELDQAIGYLQDILSDSSLTFLHGDTLVKLGILHYEKKDLDKARTNLLRAKTEFSSLTSGRIASQYLRWIEYKQPSSTAAEDSPVGAELSTK